MPIVKKITGFLTSDDTFYHTEKEASIAEAQLEFIAWCQNNICVGGEWNADMVTKAILEKWTVKHRESS